MLSPFELAGRFVELMNTGGIVMWVLFVLNFFLWYGLGYRYFILKRGTKGNVRRLINKHETRGEEQAMRGILDYAVADALHAASEAQAIGANVRKHINGVLLPYYSDVNSYRIMIRTIVVLAPLVGLLGTVVGMIETFDALQNSSMFSQGTSISGGISKALFTTELGLVVAVPGLILGRVLDKQAERYEVEFEQITDIISTKDAQ
ncbi:MAG: MotA/TolQ/ExbB proton channel family protein [Campylobacterales bacterium]|nr:MotA/TolQ/ExbB proton channel family protein [Campylobacterales bacterium]HEO99752.1 MotA/TolQ/ExbB proton channel family protein [Campylobacterota bacterium]